MRDARGFRVSIRGTSEENRTHELDLDLMDKPMFTRSTDAIGETR
jgi:hypothetical protein